MKYSSTVATIFTGIASALLFGHPLTMNFILGISIVFISMHQVIFGCCYLFWVACLVFYLDSRQASIFQFFSPLAKVRDEPQNGNLEMDYQKNYRCTLLSSFMLCESKTDIHKRSGLPCDVFPQQAFRCLSLDLPFRLCWIKYLLFIGVANVKRLSKLQEYGGILDSGYSVMYVRRRY